jgi:acetyl esterase/lipase
MVSAQTLEIATCDDQLLRADLYMPSRPSSCPALIAVSGGGWLRGSRTMLADWGKYLASQGYAVLSIDYRQSADGPSYPVNLQNVQAACAYLHEQATDLSIDRNRIGLLGVSSGAHLAALAALTRTSHPITVLALVYGIYDLAAHWQFEKGRAAPESIPLTEKMLGCRPLDNQSLYELASPLRLVGTEHTKALRALVAWGCDDAVVTPHQSESFAAALTHAGAIVRTLPVADAGHFWFSMESPWDPESRAGATAPALLTFLRTYL